jgi:pimeloyl-ACP methyl ester carboxylesterase
MTALSIEPFSIRVSDDVLDDLRSRLARTRFPAPSPGEPWAYGTDLGYVRELCRYWKDEYDWRVHEAALNAFPQFRTVIDGQRIHFLHVRSAEPHALTLIITHGWPGSVAEFMKIIGPLADPAAHGGERADAFHVICPSMPGYAFSGPTTTPGWDTLRIAEAWKTLMAGLGYARYGAQGGDWGAMITTQLGLIDFEHVCGIHLNMVIAGPPPGADMSALTDKEKAALADMVQFQQTEFAYAMIQGTKPQTLGYGLEDSPAGLAAWISEKFRTWTDCGGDIERAVTRDELLTNIMLYWLTGTAHSSARLYYETMKAKRFGYAGRRVEVPTGCAIFPREIMRPPRRWAEAAYNVTRWTELEAGGHFAALEQPEALVRELRAHFRTLR